MKKVSAVLLLILLFPFVALSADQEDADAAWNNMIANKDLADLARIAMEIDEAVMDSQKAAALLARPNALPQDKIDGDIDKAAADVHEAAGDILKGNGDDEYADGEDDEDDGDFAYDAHLWQDAVDAYDAAAAHYSRLTPGSGADQYYQGAEIEYGRGGDDYFLAELDYLGL